MARTPALDDLAKLRSISDVQVAPGGERIAYVVTTPDPVTSTIWVDERPMTEGKAPRWLPDGSLAFVRACASDAGQGGDEIRILPTTGESTVHVKVETGVIEHAWSADGSRVAYTTIAEKPEPDAPIVVDRLLNKLDGFGRITGRSFDVFVHDGTESARLTTAGALISGITWSGDDLLFAAALHDDRDLDGAIDVHRISSAGGDIESITSWTGSAGAPVVDASPRIEGASGDRILFVGISESSPMVMNGVFEADEKPRPLLADLDRNVLTGGPGYPGAPLRADGRGGLVLCIRDHGYAPLVHITAAGKQSTLVDGVVSSASIDPASGVVAAVVTTDTSPEEVVVTSLDGGTVRQLTNLNDEFRVEPPEEHWFTAPDGTKLQGWLRIGEGVGPHPLYVDIHGGPHNAWSPVFDSVHLNHLELATRGWAILTLNPRASDGYGQAFWAGTDGDWGLADEQDFHAAIDALIDEGVADASKIAVGGYSYGGYMSAWLIGRSDRFAAAMVGAPVVDAHAMHGQSDVAAQSLWREWRGRRPWDAPDWYREISPITYVDRVDTPTLLLHGDADTRCPVGESERFFAALRARGVPSQLVLYPGESHVFIVNGTLAHRRDYQQRIVDWLVEHVSGTSGEHGADGPKGPGATSRSNADAGSSERQADRPKGPEAQSGDQQDGA